ncbi:MAG TPA: hypothetical protein VIX73_00250 [Kofleriaceae bacterium]|jgi:hypothetical protein
MAKVWKMPHVPHPSSGPYCVGPYRGPDILDPRRSSRSISGLAILAIVAASELRQSSLGAPPKTRTRATSTIVIEP